MYDEHAHRHRAAADDSTRAVQLALSTAQVGRSSLLFHDPSHSWHAGEFVQPLCYISFSFASRPVSCAWHQLIAAAACCASAASAYRAPAASLLRGGLSSFLLLPRLLLHPDDPPLHVTDTASPCWSAALSRVLSALRCLSVLRSPPAAASVSLLPYLPPRTSSCPASSIQEPEDQ